MSRYNKTISTRTKLFLSSLAFLLPIGVLSFFMDLSFVYDINIALSEKAGIRYLKKVAPVYEILPLLMGDAVSVRPVPIERKQALLSTIETLRQSKKTYPKTYRYIPTNNKASEQAEEALGTLTTLVEQMKSTPDPENVYLMGMAVESLIYNIAQATLLTLDPVPDSHYLSETLISGLPEYINHLLRHHQLFAEFSAMPKQELERRIIESDAKLKNTASRYIISSGFTAISEDSKYYKTSPILQNRFQNRLAEFTESHKNFIQIVSQPSSDMDLQKAATNRLFLSAGETFKAGLSALDTLLAYRLESYQFWRGMGAISGISAMVIAFVLVTWVFRGITRPIKAVTRYADRIKNEHYNEKPKQDAYLGEFAELTSNITHMVDAIKERMAFNKGVLESISAPFLVCDEKGNLKHANCDMYEFLELFSVTILPGSNISTLFSVSSDLQAQTLESINSDSKKHISEMVFGDTKNLHRFISVFITPLHNNEGIVEGSCIHFFDLTDLKGKEKEITRLASFPNENPSPVLSCDTSGNIEYYNPATASILQRDHLTINDFTPYHHQNIVKTCLKTGQTRGSIEHRVGGRIYEWGYHPLEHGHEVQIHVRDITDKKRIEEQLLHDAFHDALTDLPNRALFLDRLRQTVLSAIDSKVFYGLLYLDIDRFKWINDSLGHHAGDMLLQLFSDRILGIVPPGVTMARLGGDEFTLLVPTISGPEQVISIAANIHSAMSEAFDVNGNMLNSTVSIGIVCDNGGYSDPSDIIRDADIAMYRAKSEGVNQMAIFDPAMHASAKNRLLVEMDMKKGIYRNEFIPFFQPLVRLKDNSIEGFEALARWNHPDKGMVYPGDFISVAEETGLIVQLGLDILEKACAATSSWQKEFPAHAHMMISVNLSPKQFESQTIVSDIKDILERTHIDPRNLKLEITESAVMKNASNAMGILNQLQEMGILLSIDDFGTGYSSLSYLTQFPFEYLKVDRSFVIEMHKPDNKKIIETIVSLAHDLGKSVIAEGIETKDQLDDIKKLGCEIGQGYYFDKPLPAAEIPAILSRLPGQIY